MSTRTSKFGFTLIDYNTRPWDQIEHDNWNSLDTALAAITSIPNYRGAWSNGTAYGIGQTVLDTNSLIFYRCLVAHQSASSGQFADDRLANPTYWSLYDQSATDPFLKKTDATFGDRNKLIDGRFDYWFEGLGVSGTGYGGATAWRATVAAGAAAVISRQAFTLGQTAVPGDPRFFCRFIRTAAGTGSCSLNQRIRGVQTLGGRTVRYRFYAKSNIATPLTVRATQVFGTGGSPSASVDVSDAAAIPVGNWTLIKGSLIIPSVAGKTLGTNSDDYLQFALEALSSDPLATIDIAMVQLWEGNTDAPYEYSGASEELSRLQQVYNTSYPLATVPGTIQTDGRLIVKAATISEYFINIVFPTVMLTVPTVTPYSTTGAANTCRDPTGNADIAATARSVSRRGTTLCNTGMPSTINAELSFHYVADCRL